MKYAEYKDSSVDWIGKVPIHWNIMRGKFIVKVLPGYAFDSKKFTSDEGISLIRIRDINNTSTEMRAPSGGLPCQLTATSSFLVPSAEARKGAKG